MDTSLISSSCGASVVVLRRPRGGNKLLFDVLGRFERAANAGFWNARAFGRGVVEVVVVACVDRARPSNGDRRVETATAGDVRGVPVGWKRFAFDVNGRLNLNNGLLLRRAFSVVVVIASSPPSSLFSSASDSPSGLLSGTSVLSSSDSGAFVVVLSRNDGAIVGLTPPRNRT